MSRNGKKLALLIAEMGIGVEEALTLFNKGRARRQVGKAIKQAANSKRLAYITARGVVESSVLKCERENFKCI